MGRPPPPHSPEPPKGPPALMHTYRHTTQTPMRPPASYRRQPRYPYSTPRVQFAPCPLFPPPLSVHFWMLVGRFSLSTSPPLRGKGMFSMFRWGGGGRGTKADTSLFPVSADRLKGSNVLEMSSVKAHGHTDDSSIFLWRLCLWDWCLWD